MALADTRTRGDAGAGRTAASLRASAAGEASSALATDDDGSTRLYRLEAGSALSGLQVEAFVLEEALSEPWRLELSLLHRRADLAIDAMLTAPVSLVTRLSDGREHRRTGLVAQAAAEDSDGGFARYRLTVQPWLGFLGQSWRSRAWQDCSVAAIVDSVLVRYAVRGNWRWLPCVVAHLAGAAGAGVRSYCLQHRESDLDFISRLLAENGIGYRFEEGAGGDSPGPTVVFFADSTSAASMPQDAASASAAGGAGIRFHADGAQEEQDTVQAFGWLRSQPVAVVAAVSYDPRSGRVVGAEVPTIGAVGGEQALRIEAYDTTQGNAFANTAQAEWALRLKQQALEARHKRWIGRGVVRSFCAGETFTLTESMLDHFPAPRASADDARRFLLTRVTHVGINNLPKETNQRLARGTRHGAGDLFPRGVDPELIARAAARGYANRFEATRASVPWRPLLTDAGGVLINPKPQAAGPLIATVVGPDGSRQPRGPEEVHTDRLGRVLIRYDFQDDEPDGAPASTWVRVLQPLASDGVGSRWTPRIGHEVLVGFFDDDIDQPYIVCSLYHGRGEGGEAPTPAGQPGAPVYADVFRRSSDARPGGQGNLTGGASPAWHGGSAGAVEHGGQRNAAALSGYKTKEFGGGGFNQLVFDDSPAQLRLQLATSQHATQLNLGHLIHQADNHRGSFRGLGFELRTDAYGAVRGGRGVLLSTYAIAAADPAGENAAGIALARQWQTLADAFNRATTTHQTVQLTGVTGTTRSGSGQPAPVAGWVRQANGRVSAASFEAACADAEANASATANPTADLTKGVTATATATATATEPGTLPHGTDAVVSVSARAGLALVAGLDVVFASEENLQFGSGGDIDIAVGGALRLHTGQAIGILGGAVKPGAKAAGTGLTMVAGAGDVELQAQDGTLQVAALDDVRIESRSASVEWAAARKLTLSTAGGARIVIEGGDITVECPGTLTIRAGTKSFLGPQRVDYALPTLPQQVCLDCLLRARQTGSRIVLA